MEERKTDTVALDAMSSHIRLLSPGCEVGDRYEVHSVLGIGGSGVVYAVFDRELRRRVALKVLRSDRMSESALKRFRREVAVARDAQSPHLVRVFDLAQSADSIYLTMELIEGESLSRRLDRGPLPIEETVVIGSQILTAIAALHGIGIVHRDIKPSNVMLTTDGTVKLTDFGLARRMDSETRATETEAIVGTYEYISPEQAMGDEIDARSDLFSFGILLWECLTGDVPLRGGSSLGTVIAHVSKPVPDIRRRNHEVPGWMAAIVARLLKKDRSERYQSAAEVQQDLNRRRAPRRRLRVPHWKVAIAAVAIVVAAIAINRRIEGSRFATLVHDGSLGARAFNGRGELMWSNPVIQPGVRSAIVKNKGRPVQIVAVESDPTRADPLETHRLSVIDPQTGRTIRHVGLESQAGSFPAFSPTFGACRMAAVDIDHDELDEVVVSFCHTPFWPSYTLFYDPRREAAYPVFIASGHHRLAGTADIDRDGRDELILWGPSNRLGWYTGIAAVRVHPQGWDDASPIVASTPDATYSSSSARGLLWYALAGSGGYDHGMAATVDREHRRIVLEFGTRSRTVLDLDGFLLNSSTSPLDVRKRTTARAQAYEGLRQAIRMSESGFAAEAIRLVDDAVLNADRAREVPLGVWARRVRIKVHVAAGRGSAIEPLLHDVMARFDSPADACLDAASAFHLRGELRHAVRWYSEGIRRLSESKRGRVSIEFLEGIVFAYAEMEEWEEARRALESLKRAFPREAHTFSHYDSWLNWRVTGRFPKPLEHHNNDLIRYLALESEAAAVQGKPDAFIARVDAAVSTSSGVYKPLLKSLKAEILARNGDETTAFDLANQAFEEALGLLTVETQARAHFPVITRRLSTLARARGDKAVSARVESKLRELRGQYAGGRAAIHGSNS